MAVNNYALNNVERFKFWCQKVLPLVYDDSLSYYEVLCKVVSKVNEVIDNENAQNELLNELNSEVGSLAQAQSEQYEELSRAISQGADAILALQTAMSGKVDKAQSASDNGKVLGIVNGQVTPVELPADNVLYATYNVTPFSEIYSAWDRDILVVVSMVNQQGHYEHAVLNDISTTTATFIIPASPSDGSYEKITCTASGWDVETVQYSEESIYVATRANDTYSSVVEQINAGKTVIVKSYSELLGTYCVYANVTGNVATDPVLNPNPLLTFACFDGETIYKLKLSPTGGWNEINTDIATSYIVTYGTSTYNEIVEANSANKIVRCLNGTGTYATLVQIANDYASFAIPSANFITMLTVSNNDVWTSESYNYSKVYQVSTGGANPSTYSQIVWYLNHNYICTFYLNNECYIAFNHYNNDSIVFTAITSDELSTWTIDSNNTWSNDHKGILFTKQSLSNAGKILSVTASGDTTWIPEKIFLGVYGTTTYAEVYQAAITENKFIVIGDLTSMKYYTAAFADLQGKLYFSCDNKLIYIDPVNGWSNEIDNSPVFYATANVTTFDEIATAYRAGKVCCINEGNDIYTLSYIAFDTGATFAHPTANGNSFKHVSISDVWS